MTRSVGSFGLVKKNISQRSGRALSLPMDIYGMLDELLLDPEFDELGGNVGESAALGLYPDFHKEQDSFQ